MEPATLKLKDTCTGGATVQATVEADERGISLGFSGYGDFGSAAGFGRPVFIELRAGQLTVHVWADIGQEDPTHVIRMGDALQT